MTSSETEKEALVLVGFAAAMEAIQQFEQALKGLAVLREDLPDGIDADVAWKRVERLLRLPIGQLEYVFPPGLKEHFAELKRTRNWAAHEALVVWRLERNLGLRSDEEVVKTLVDVEEAFRELEEQLSMVADQHLEQLGIKPDDYISPEMRCATWPSETLSVMRPMIGDEQSCRPRRWASECSFVGGRRAQRLRAMFGGSTQLVSEVQLSRNKL